MLGLRCGVSKLTTRGWCWGRFELHVPGRHNVLNATAAVAVGVQLGVAPEQIAAGLGTFRGVDRRFQVKGVVGGVTVVDDYGHHPTEIVATLKAARECGYGRVHVIFQPHRYTRTRDLMEEFAGAFREADSVEVLDIYAASEDPASFPGRPGGDGGGAGGGNAGGLSRAGGGVCGVGGGGGGGGGGEGGGGGCGDYAGGRQC